MVTAEHLRSANPDLFEFLVAVKRSFGPAKEIDITGDEELHRKLKEMQGRAASAEIAKAKERLNAQRVAT